MHRASKPARLRSARSVVATALAAVVLASSAHDYGSLHQATYDLPQTALDGEVLTLYFGAIDASPPPATGSGAPMETQQQRRTRVDRFELLPRHAAEDALHSALVDGPHLIGKSVRRLDQSARPRCQDGPQRAVRRRSGHGNDRHERVALIVIDGLITHDDVRPYTALLVIDRRVERTRTSRPRSKPDVLTASPSANLRRRPT